MNIISNDCMGGFIYRNAKAQFNNPFMWTYVMYDDMLYFMNNWDSIDWKNFIVLKDDSWKMYVQFNGAANIHCLHYHFDARFDKPHVYGHDVFHNHIWEYIHEKFTARISRMNETPTFVFEWLNWLGCDKEKFESFIKQDFKYKTIVFIPYAEYKDFKKDNLLVIYDPKVDAKDVFPNYYANRYFDVIKDFVK